MSHSSDVSHSVLNTLKHKLKYTNDIQMFYDDL